MGTDIPVLEFTPEKIVVLVIVYGAHDATVSRKDAKYINETPEMSYLLGSIAIPQRKCLKCWCRACQDRPKCWRAARAQHAERVPVAEYHPVACVVCTQRWPVPVAFWRW